MLATVFNDDYIRSLKTSRNDDTLVVGGENSNIFAYDVTVL